MKIKETIIFLAATVIFSSGIAWFYTKSYKEPIGQRFVSQGQEHIAIGASHALYNSNPPTSGPHYVKPADWGIYQSEIPDEQLVHNLEHGGVWISYKGIDSKAKTKLEDIARRYPGKMIVTPRDGNDVGITLASWTLLENLDTVNEKQIVEFIKANKNKSPESLAQ